jgi:hypothetical protein
VGETYQTGRAEARVAPEVVVPETVTIALGEVAGSVKEVCGAGGGSWAAARAFDAEEAPARPLRAVRWPLSARLALERSLDHDQLRRSPDWMLAVRPPERPMTSPPNLT